MRDDGHGTALRAAMMKSMEEPYKSFNVRQPRMVHPANLATVVALVMAVGIAAVYLLNYLEGWFR